MPDVTNRASKEREIKAALRKCRDSQKKELLRILGDPPDYRNVPDEFWEEAEKCERSSLLPLLIPMFIVSNKKALKALGMDVDESKLLQDANRLVNKRLDFLVSRGVRHSKTRLRKKLQTRAKREVFTEEDLESIFGRSRIDGIATTEVAQVNSDANQAAANDFAKGRKEGVDFVRVWRLGGCQHCVFCPAVADTDREFWGKFSQGPQAHPRCCCFLDLLLMSKEEARSQGLVRSRYPSEAYASAAARIVGVK